MSRSPLRSLTVLAATGLVAAVVLPTSAQERADQQAVQRASQGGNQFRGGQNPIRRDQASEFRARNNLVTGNVAGGRGFRGSVGYASPFDFRGELGSDDLFEFRAATALSQVATTGAAFDALRYSPTFEVLEYFRSGAGVSAGDLRQRSLAEQEIRDLSELNPLAADRLARARAAIDASAFDASVAASIARQAQPVAVGTSADEDGSPFRIGASTMRGIDRMFSGRDLSLRGVQTYRDADAAALGLTPFDTARLIQDAQLGGLDRSVGAAFRTDYRSLADTPVDTRSSSSFLDGVSRPAAPGDDLDNPLAPNVGGPDRVDARAGVEQRTTYERVLESIAERYAGASRGEQAAEPTRTDLERLERRMEDLRRQLRGGGPEVEGDDAGTDDGLDFGTGTETPGAGGDSATSTPGLFDPVRPEAEQQGEGDDDGVAWDPRDIGRILRHGERIDSLVSVRDRSRAAELLADGEQELRAGNYFRAERLFMRAIRMVPGHPTATIGLAHARIGAGLSMPAAIVLRDLFTFQPEVIGATYDAGLVPNRPRLLRAREEMRTRLDRNISVRESALLMAYLGHLLDDQASIRDGIDALRVVLPDDPLTPVLEAVWLTERGRETGTEDAEAGADADTPDTEDGTGSGATDG